MKQNDNAFSIYVLENENNRIELSDLGATLVSWKTKKSDGSWQEIVLGYDDLDSYRTQDGYLGACLGRVANRIKKGQFTLNDTVYTLPINNGPNCLHGGIDGFSYKRFDVKQDESSLAFHYVSKDQEEGFPGNLDVWLTYSLKKNTLTIHYEALSDADTLVNLSNHSYFNLEGSDSIQDHRLLVKASKFMEVDADGLVKGVYRDLPADMDFQQEKPIGQALSSSIEQIEVAKGIDHPYLFNDSHDPIVLRSPLSHLVLTMNTSYPLAQIYSANYLDGRLGKGQRPMPKQSGICFEAQYLPNEINIDPQTKTILRKGEKYDEWTSYTISYENSESIDQ
ncbi:aldose epimerase family protein [Dubosiella newyorkensis]|uniref:aldose epimerase family protein n=1 Tax=Dubosiella newyorkensis TaxID=1862672 RepID=UPI0023F05B61|nr:aldose epimerase family protein [Dubosiella newyorkensis]